MLVLLLYPNVTNCSVHLVFSYATVCIYCYCIEMWRTVVFIWCWPMQQYAYIAIVSKYDELYCSFGVGLCNSMHILLLYPNMTNCSVHLVFAYAPVCLYCYCIQMWRTVVFIWCWPMQQYAYILLLYPSMTNCSVHLVFAYATVCIYCYCIQMWLTVVFIWCLPMQQYAHVAIVSICDEL
jgi:hypothetical protein